MNLLKFPGGDKKVFRIELYLMVLRRTLIEGCIFLGVFEKKSKETRAFFTYFQKVIKYFSPRKNGSFFGFCFDVKLGKGWNRKKRISTCFYIRQVFGLSLLLKKNPEFHLVR